MNENKTTGCGVWALVAILLSALFSTFTFNSEITIESPVPTTIPTLTPSFITTVQPQETDAYFVLENNQISYSRFQTLGMPCYYYIVGRVLDMNGQAFTDFVVNIQMIGLEEGVTPPAPGYRYAGMDGYIEDGASHWGALLPSWRVAYEIWLTTEIGGEELSPHIYVDMRDCDQNEARVNFVQVKPLP
jgi:hypothetical protein